MFILTWIVLSIVNNGTEVPEWILATVGLAAFIEVCWWVFVILATIVNAIIEKVRG